jgi:hypothetical protein
MKPYFLALLAWATGLLLTPPVSGQEARYVPAGTEQLIRVCLKDGYSLSVMVTPAVALGADGRAPRPLPVDAFLQGISTLMQAQARKLDRNDLLLPDSPGARALSDAVDAWIHDFNRERGIGMAWAVGRFGLSGHPQADCSPPR